VSRYEDFISPDWDRSDPAVDLVDVGTGAPIRDIDHNGGWIRLTDGNRRARWRSGLQLGVGSESAASSAR
jgi:hypothetical protein